MSGQAELAEFRRRLDEMAVGDDVEVTTEVADALRMERVERALGALGDRLAELEERFEVEVTVITELLRGESWCPTCRGFEALGAGG